MNSSGLSKQESGGTDDNSRLTSKTTPSSSRQWEGLKNPRIVSVSRTFKGKDRHSKVCTIRGLRDRRIRLSVPTAIQLYDLQDRLGFSQPSKVVDWLLKATKLDIDKLPPLPGYFNHAANSKATMSASNEQENQQEDNIGGQSLFPLGNRSSNLPGHSYYQWEHNSDLSLGHFEESQNDFPLSLASGSQLYFNPIATTFQPVVPPYMINYPIESTDPREQMNFNFLSSSSPQHVLPNPLVMPTLNLFSSQMKPFSLDDDPRWINSRHDDDNS